MEGHNYIAEESLGYFTKRKGRGHIPTFKILINLRSFEKKKLDEHLMEREGGGGGADNRTLPPFTFNIIHPIGTYNKFSLYFKLSEVSNCGTAK